MIPRTYAYALTRGRNLRESLAIAMQLGCKVQHLRRTGELSISHEAVTPPIKINMRRKDTPVALYAFLRRVSEARKALPPVAAPKALECPHSRVYEGVALKPRSKLFYEQSKPPAASEVEPIIVPEPVAPEPIIEPEPTAKETQPMNLSLVKAEKNNTKCTISIQLKPADWKRARIVAATKGLSASAYIESLLAADLKVEIPKAIEALMAEI